MTAVAESQSLRILATPLGLPMERASLPKESISVTSYADLERYVAKIADRSLDLLLLIGRPGTGKTERVRRVIAQSCGDRALHVEGHVQPFGMYCGLWQHRDQPIILDDLDKLYSNPDSVRLLKPLCDSRDTKRVSWLTNATRQEDGPPQSFETRSPVILIANEWRTVNANVRALEDRAIIVHFNPTNAAIHQEVAEWCEDDVVYEFVGRHLSLVPTVSMRWYAKGQRLRQAGFDDWQTSLLQMMCGDRALAVVAGLLADPSLASEKVRVQAFGRATGMSRASYFRLKRKLGLPRACMEAR